MNIGIIVYSQTGNTRTVVDMLAKTLKKHHHDVNIESLQPVLSEKKPQKVLLLSEIPDVSPYEYLILASPVHAFSLAPAMQLCLKSWSDLTGKRAGLILTQHFPYPWMGGTRAMNQFKKTCQEKGASTEVTGIVNWSNKKRDEQIDRLIDLFSQSVGSGSES